MTDVASTENSYKNHRERCICMACSIVAVATEAAEVIDRLENEREHLRKDRDEARREVLLWVKERCSWEELAQEIKKRGWEYLKEEGK